MPFGVFSRASMNSGNVSQFHGNAAAIASYEIASLRVSESMARSRPSAFTGAMPKPQLPITTEVTPCQPLVVQ